MSEERGSSMSSLTLAETCHRNANFGMEMNHAEKTPVYYRAVIMKAAITNALRHSLWDRHNDPHWKVNMKRDVMEYMKTRYSECGFMNWQQQQAQLIFDHRLVTRYLKEETRKVSFPQGGNVDVGGKQIFVKPDAAVEFGDQIELIWYKIGKPTMTQTGKKNTFARDLQLYAGVLYGRMLGYKYITASYYFLQMKDDKEEWGKNRQDFFGDGGNIISMSDIYLGQPTDIDKQVKEHLEILHDGMDPEKMPEEECEKCRLREICKYTLPPVRMAK